jgi:hypothetical protein
MLPSGRGLPRGAAVMHVALGRAAAALLAVQMALAPAAGAAEAARESKDARTTPVLTVKERLSSKASDDQRVDNCNVSPELRGPKSRPDCRQRPSAAPTH